MQSGSIEKLYEDNFNIYKAFTTAEQKLFLSYASSDAEGKPLRNSIIITKIKKIFPKVNTQSDVIKKNLIITNKQAMFHELLTNLKSLIDGEIIDDIWHDVYLYYSSQTVWNEKLKTAIKGIGSDNNPEKISKENIEKLYGKVLRTSISKLEQYKSCPFSYYLKYGLKLSDKNKFKIQSIDTGTFMHDVIDSFFKIIKEEKINVKEITDEKLNKIIDNIIDEKLALSKNYIFISTEKYKILTMRLKKVIKKSMKYIIESLKLSKFDIYETELEFKENTKYKPLKIILEDGKKAEVIGKIDRIDLYKNEDGKYIRIIDYKSSVKSLDLNEVIGGVQIQLLTYLNEVTKLEDAQPGGVLYFNLLDPIIKSSKNLSEEEIENEIRKKFKMQGLIIADINIIKSMDTSLEKGASNVIPAYIDAKGELSRTRSSIATKEQFQMLQEYTNKIIKQIAKEILSGDIDIKPTYYLKNKKTPCEYCEYKSICGFGKRNCKDNYNYIGKKDKEVILENLKKSS